MTVTQIFRSDPFRLALQATLAALACLFVGRALGMEEVSWCVISALFTVQASVGGTLASAASRIVGAVAGLAIGVACVLLMGSGVMETAIGLAVGVAAMSLLSAFKPELSYGLVTVAIVLLAPGDGALETAWTKAMAIALGTGMGTLAAVAVLPQQAHRSAERHLGQAMQLCRDLLRGSVSSFTGTAEVDVRAIHASILTELQAASTKVSGSQFRRLARRRSHAPRPSELLAAVQDVWSAVNLFERLDANGMPRGSQAILADPLDALDKALGEHFCALGKAIAERSPAPSASALHKRAEAVMDAMVEVRRQGATQPLPTHEAEQVFILSLAIEQTLASLDRITDMLGTR